jgi:glyoxylase-like metal-dependent hydrolase (beta-lactamase superfamily II)
MAEADTVFDTDRTVRHAVPEPVADGVQRVVARNPSPMTFTGTATYLVGTDDVAIIDPGPDDAAHAAAVLGAVPSAARVSAILLTHSHLDHSGNTNRLREATGAPVLAFGGHGTGRSTAMTTLAAQGVGGGEGADNGFAPDVLLADGERVTGAGWALRAVHTPGHLGNHLCFALEATGVLFSGDTVMGWSTTMVSPPDGDMADFMASLRKLAARKDRLLLPGHGKPVVDPGGMIAWQIAHREAREASILAALDSGPRNAMDLVTTIYKGLDPALKPAAARNVLAHLLALQQLGRVRLEGALTPGAVFALA